MTDLFPPTRTAALERLRAFLPHAGSAYANGRNYDLPGHPHVSQLSPYVRHRALTEPEIITATLDRFALSTAQKYVQEVFWRTYWKGWLERRPSVWIEYKTDLGNLDMQLDRDRSLAQRYAAAKAGETGIEAFDHWMGDLRDTGYLHNHARMWAASIWIFTLGLPWQLGARHFLHHLLDGDPASNTLSWRWVAGRQTAGKTYLARPSNIAKYTEGRFNPDDLAPHAPAPEMMPHAAPGPVPESARIPQGERRGFLLTEEDLSPAWCLTPAKPDLSFVLIPSKTHASGSLSPDVAAFKDALVADAATRHADALGPLTQGGPDALRAWISAHQITEIVTPYMPVGPTAEAVAGTPGLCPQLRRYDALSWVHATKGFFAMGKAIPALIDQIGLKG